MNSGRVRSLFLDRGGEDQAQLAKRPAGFGGPAVEVRLDQGAVLAVLWRGIHRGPALQTGSDRVGQDEGVLADHAQKGRAGIAAHLAEALRQRLPQLDDVRPWPIGEPGAKATMLLGDADHRGSIVPNRFELAPMADQAPVAEQRLERLVRHRPYPARLETFEDLF